MLRATRVFDCSDQYESKFRAGTSKPYLGQLHAERNHLFCMTERSTKIRQTSNGVQRASLTCSELDIILSRQV